MKNLLIVLLVLFPSILFAGNVDDKQALGDLKAVKFVCDVNVGKAKLLLRRLELIDETYSQLIDAGVTPTVVVTFRGGASLYVTRGVQYVDAKDAGIKKEIQGWIDQFSQHGFRIEQCAIAAKAQKVDPADFLPSFKTAIFHWWPIRQGAMPCCPWIEPVGRAVGPRSNGGASPTHYCGSRPCFSMRYRRVWRVRPSSRAALLLLLSACSSAERIRLRSTSSSSILVEGTVQGC